MGKLETTWSWMGRHKYLIVCVLFFSNLLFLDHNSLLQRYAQHKEISELKAEKEKYSAISARDTKMLHELDSDPHAIEKVARERYFMKADDEDVFVFEYEDNKDNTVNEASE